MPMSPTAPKTTAPHAGGSIRRRLTHSGVLVPGTLAPQGSGSWVDGDVGVGARHTALSPTKAALTLTDALSEDHR